MLVHIERHIGMSTQNARHKVFPRQLTEIGARLVRHRRDVRREFMTNHRKSSRKRAERAGPLELLLRANCRRPYPWEDIQAYSDNTPRSWYLTRLRWLTGREPAWPSDIPDGKVTGNFA